MERIKGKVRREIRRAGMLLALCLLSLMPVLNAFAEDAADKTSVLEESNSSLLEGTRITVFYEKIDLNKGEASICGLTGNTYVVSVNSMSIMSGPGNDYTVVGKLVKGSTVKVYSISNGWAEIKYNGSKAYVKCSDIMLIG